MIPNDDSLSGGIDLGYSKVRRKSFGFFLTTLLTSSFFILLVYWILYLYINVQTRLQSSLGFSDFPLPSSAPMYLYSIGISGEWPYWILYTAFFITLAHAAIYGFLHYKGKKTLSHISLMLPALYPILYVIYAYFLITTSCNGEECGWSGVVAYLVTLIAVGFSLSILALTIISYFFVRAAKKRMVVLYIFTFIFLFSIFTPLFLPRLLFNPSTTSNVIVNEIKVSQVALQKKSTILDWTKMNIFFRSNDQDFQKRSSGEVVLAKLVSGRLLIQEKAKIDSEEVPRANLFVEDNNKLTNITEGVKFVALYAGPSAVNSKYSRLYSNGPLSYSLTKDKLAFVQGGSLTIIKLDGSGILIDEQFCTGMINQIKVPLGEDSYTCNIDWDYKGIFYGLVEFGSFNRNNEDVVFEIIIPEF